MGGQEEEANNRTVGELVTQLGRVAYGMPGGRGLTSAQWMALRYFARANRFSRTVSSFAEYHATTRGTASKTVKGLVDRRYLSRTPSGTDGRSARIDMTLKARSVLAHDPLVALVRAVGALSPRARTQLENSLKCLLGRLANETGRCHFGTCASCLHLDCLEGDEDRVCECALWNEPLEAEEIEQICVGFEPGA